MKEKTHIDQLFQKASQLPTATSFDEAKTLFINSLTKNPKKGKRNRIKKWIIMSILISISLIASLFILGGNSNESTKSSVKNDGNGDMSLAKTQEQQSTSNHSLSPTEQKNILHSAKRFDFTPMSPAEQRRALKNPERLRFVHPSEPLLTRSQSPYIFDFAADRREKKDLVELPQLTEKEVSENEKYKRKMMKAIAKHDKGEYAYIPSGSTKYRGHTYSVQAFLMQVNEVTNLQYRTFLNDLLIQGRKEDYQKAFPQEEKWTEEIEGDVLSMRNQYFTNPAYEDYPVVNVTREGAELYCRWLTSETNKSKYVNDGEKINDLRLPQRLEWTYAACSGIAEIVYPWGCDSTQNKEGCYLANYNPDSSDNYADGAFMTAKTGTYTPNPFGLYNMSGNVAEMVYGTTNFSSKNDLISLSKEPGTAGGGWMDDAEALKIEGDDPYEGRTEGHPNVGFRVVITHINKSE